LIVQVLQTDSIEYVVEVKKKLSVDAKLELDETVKKASTLGDFEVKVAYESDKKYSLVVKGKPMSVGYKRFRIGVPLEPES
jgi:hypothetical protein